MQNKVLFVDAFSPSNAWYADGKPHTVDGALLNDLGYRKLAGFLPTPFQKAKPESKFRPSPTKPSWTKIISG